MSKQSISVAPLGQQKACSRCKRVLLLSEFSPDVRTVLGVGSQCKTCNRERMKGYTARTKAQRSAYNRAYRKKNRKRLKEANLKWRLTNQERVVAYRKERYAKNKGRILAYLRKYNRKNRARINARQRAYYEGHKGEHRERNRQWRRKNPEKLKANIKKRRALKAGAVEAKLTAAQWRAIQEAFDYRCAYCGCRPKKLTQDHVVPLCKGGSHTVDNVVPACGRCNCKKWANTLPMVVKPKEIKNG